MNFKVRARGMGVADARAGGCFERILALSLPSELEARTQLFVPGRRGREGSARRYVHTKGKRCELGVCAPSTCQC